MDEDDRLIAKLSFVFLVTLLCFVGPCAIMDFHEKNEIALERAKRPCSCPCLEKP